MARRKSGFNTPFVGLSLPEAAAPKLEDRSPEELAAARAPEASKLAKADPEAAFAMAMEGVAPLSERGSRVAPQRPPHRRRRTEDEEALAELAALVDGDLELDLHSTDEMVEGNLPGLDRRVLKRLRRGDFSVQAVIDLHGMTRDEAGPAVREFLVANRQKGHRCVRIITGRGNNSKDQVAILRERLKTWLTRSGMAKHVVAFTSARPCDGGTGAVYVLLRAN